MEPEAEGLSTLLRACFCKSLNNRRNILMHWHTGRTIKAEDDRVASHFESFMESILFAPMSFVLYPSHFVIFGNAWPVYRRWFVISPPVISPPLQGGRNDHDISHFFDWLVSMGLQGRIFDHVKELPNGQYEMGKPRNFREDSIITTIHRRELVREFVRMIWAQENPGLRQEMLAAIQGLLQKHREDIFLPTLHYVCQRQDARFVEEIVCRGLNQWDE